ncbi:PadR family transcriptional regulator [Dankookia sp. GCM10030260]|uniref:PadR family transcriptional regulator n=1 Tax=Dankookia sp. GCM10030260 TaxID=3273390 RepID=UPI003609F476
MLHHAAEHEVYGLWMIEELARHSYRLSAGTLYPMLEAMQQRGYLVSRREQHGRTIRRLYRITDRGREGLAVAMERLRELRVEVAPQQTSTD